MPRGAAILVIRGPFRLPQSTSNRGAQSNTNLTLINVSTPKLRRAVRLPEGDLPIMASARVLKQN
jgi:hypothetical protein